MMLQNYQRYFIKAGMSEKQARAGLLELFDTGGDSHFRYPAPDEAHPASTDAQTRKVETAAAAIRGRANVIPSAHSYGPVDDVLARVRTALTAGDGNAWINRYGYLGDPKLNDIGRLMASREDM